MMTFPIYQVLSPLICKCHLICKYKLRILDVEITQDYFPVKQCEDAGKFCSNVGSSQGMLETTES